jgi:hypothetical protein
MDRASRRRFLLGYGIWLFGALAYFVPSATWSPVSRFNLTRAVVEQGTFSVDAFAESTGDRALRAGHWYCDKAPLPSLIAVPPYAVFYAYNRLRGVKPEFVAFSTPDTPAQRVEVNRTFQQALYVCSLSTAALAGTALGLLMFLALVRSVGSGVALFASAATVLGTPLFAYSTSFYGHVPATALIFGAVAAVTVGSKSVAFADPLDVRALRGRLRIAGLCLASSVGCEYLSAVPALFIFAYILWRGRAEAVYTLSQLALGALLPALVLGTYHWICFGLPWKTAYSFIERPEFARGHQRGFLGITLPTPQAMFGLTFGSARGLFFIAPVTLLGVALAFTGRMERNRPDSLWAKPTLDVRHALGAAAIALFLVNASYYMWWGGAAFGPRHLLPVVPLVAYGLARACLDREARVLAALLAAISFANVLSVTMVGIEAPETGNVLTEFAWTHLAAGHVAVLSGSSNLGMRLGLPSLATFGPILVWLLVGGRVVFRALPSDERDVTPDPGMGADVSSRAT